MDRTINEQLMDALIRHQIYLLRYSGSVRNKITELLNRSEEDIAAKLARYAVPANGLTTPKEMERLQALQAAISKIRLNAWGEVQQFFDSEMRDLMYQEPIVMRGIVNTVLPVTVSTVMPTANLLRAMVMAKPFEGRLMRDWAGAMAQSDILRIQNSVQLGMVAGESMQQITRRVLGTGTLMGSDGMTELTRHQVNSVVRTAVQHVANNARNAFLNENKQLFDKEQFVATLDSRTTPVCRAEDGKQYPVGEGPIPPLHYGCRSLRVATFGVPFIGSRPANPTTERMLVSDYAKKNKLGDIDSRDDLPRGTKGMYDTWARTKIRQLVGPIPATETYQTWLSKQGKGFQQDVLGVAKAKLFRDGGLKLDKFVDRNGAELTLKELAQKHAEAFRAAGMNPANYF